MRAQRYLFWRMKRGEQVLTLQRKKVERNKVRQGPKPQKHWGKALGSNVLWTEWGWRRIKR